MRIETLFQPAVQGFLIDLMSYDPPQVLAGYKGPALILQGERDIQVGADDARRLAAADPAAKLMLLPDVNHVLKTVTSDDKQANLKTYFDPKLPLAPGDSTPLALRGVSSLRPVPTKPPIPGPFPRIGGKGGNRLSGRATQASHRSRCADVLEGLARCSRASFPFAASAGA